MWVAAGLIAVTGLAAAAMWPESCVTTVRHLAFGGDLTGTVCSTPWAQRVAIAGLSLCVAALFIRTAAQETATGSRRTASSSEAARPLPPAPEMPAAPSLPADQRW